MMLFEGNPPVFNSKGVINLRFESKFFTNKKIKGALWQKQRNFLMQKK
jgi:hypothetical protein